ncbi:AB hydrolase-1 domain-containing protein [Durusdinium trenchii]|uniref:AB hydrolase-1 domain-containing protein n=1 Tax=Durusdinium trenchii TaxID=1381693 RepID=A0ABP0KKE4_9DINO
MLSDSRVRSKKYQLLETQTDSLVGAFEASPSSVLWGELFTEKDRIFLRQHLEDGSLSFGAKDTFQLEYRIVWNPEAKKQIDERGETRDGHLVVLLHSYSGRVTGSWGWIKLAKSLWKQNFTVCFLDMPGFGRSSMNMRWNIPTADWQQRDAVILAKFVNGMNFRNPVSFVGYRDSCASILRLCRDSPHLVANRHIFVDPLFVMDDIFPIDPPYGAQMDWFINEKPGKQAVEMDKVMKKHHTHFWVCFTGSSPSTEPCREALQAVTYARPHVGMRITITHLTKEFICEAQAGAKIPVQMLFLCRYVKDRFANFIAGIEKAPKEVPPWALEVASTNASTALGSKALPSVDSPAGRARHFDALETVQEAAEVLSRCTTATRRDSLAQMLEAIPQAKPIKRNLPVLAALTNTQHDDGGVVGASFTETMRQTFRTDGHSGFRDRAARPPKPGMSRYGASFLESHSEVNLREAQFHGLPSLKPSRSHQAVQRTPGGVAVCRPGDVPPPGFKTEAKRCAIHSCAQRATQKRAADPEEGRHRLLCPVRKAREALDATGYNPTPRRKNMTVEEVLAELKGKIPNL